MRLYTRPLFVFLLIAPALCLASTTTTITRQNLAELCGSEAPHERKACLSYITGFIDGALATDPQVAGGVVKVTRELNTLTERALRTRVATRLERYGPSYYAGFCLPDQWQPEGLAEQVVQENGKSQQPARLALLQILRAQHPCEETK